MTVDELIKELQGYMPTLEVKIVRGLKTKRELKDISFIGVDQDNENRVITIGVSK
jgi:hypothetical protein